MPDIFTHVLVGYSLGTLVSFRYKWLRPAHVTLVMIGALSPDFVKIKLVVPDTIMQTLLGVPFAWTPLHRLSGSVLVVCLGALFVATGHRRQAITLLALGAASHHALDLLLITPTGYSYAVGWPLLTYHFPSPDLYLSSDRWPALVAGTFAAVVWVERRRRSQPARD